MKHVLAIVVLSLLAGCGVSRGLKPAAGETLPVAAYGATARPTPDKLTTATAQQRPGRSDELLTESQERRSDEFDLPPR